MAAVRRMLAEGAGEPLTVSGIAAAAGVARKTVYAHWPSVPAVVADVLLTAHEATPEADADGPVDPVAAAGAFLRSVRDSFDDPGIRAALAVLVADAPTDRSAADALRTVTARRVADVGRIVGSEGAEETLMLLTGPLFFARFVAQTRMSDQMIDSVASQVLAQPRSLHARR